MHPGGGRMAGCRVTRIALDAAENTDPPILRKRRILRAWSPVCGQSTVVLEWRGSTPSVARIRQELEAYDANEVDPYA
jgi:hypothetical protein